jgi:hypothetical protein
MLFQTCAETGAQILQPVSFCNPSQFSFTACSSSRHQRLAAGKLVELTVFVSNENMETKFDNFCSLCAAFLRQEVC